MLPCNVVVYQKDGKRVVTAINPKVTMGSVENPKLDKIIEEIDGKLKKVIESV